MKKHVTSLVNMCTSIYIYTYIHTYTHTSIIYVSIQYAFVPLLIGLLYLLIHLFEKVSI